MLKIWTVTLALGLALVAGVTMAGERIDAAASVLAALRGDRRPLLIFHAADEASDKSVRKQLDLLHRHRKELKDREVSVLMVPDANGIGSTAAHKDWSELRQRFHVAPAEFTVVLVGKDGGEKFRSHVPVTIEKLVALIDAMPMRQQEVKDGRPE